MSEVFKLVAVGEDGDLVSYGAVGMACAIYRPGEKTLPPIAGSKLFAFDKLVNLYRYLPPKNLGDVFQAWKCEASDTEYMTHMALEAQWFWAEKFWADQLLPADKATVPHGTVCVEWLILKERVA